MLKLWLWSNRFTPAHVSANTLTIPFAKNTGYGLTAQQLHIKGGFKIYMSLPESKLAGGKIAKVTSSNKKVATQIQIAQTPTFAFIVKKYGKTTFTITVKTGKKRLKITNAILRQRNVWTWGHNSKSGQLGDGTTEDRHRPVKIDFVQSMTPNPSETPKPKPVNGKNLKAGKAYYNVSKKGTAQYLKPTKNCLKTKGRKKR